MIAEVPFAEGDASTGPGPTVPAPGTDTRTPGERMGPVKNVGFLSFGWWSRSPGSQVRSASEVMHDTIALAEAAEDAGMDGAWIRIHHFEQNTSSPFPLLAAMGARTSRVELGTGVINMRYENPLYMAEAAATADLIAGGRLQLGVSRGLARVGRRRSGHLRLPAARGEAARRGRRRTHRPVPEGDSGRRHRAARRQCPGAAAVSCCPSRPIPPGSATASGTAQAIPIPPDAWARSGMHLMSSTLVLEATGEPLGTVQARQIAAFRESWREAGHRR